jgi:pseudo-rSAM protein
MKNYWLYLEPFTFVFSRNNRTLIYNSISFNCKTFNVSSDKLRDIFSRLSDPDNLYCINISEETIKDKEIEDFINFIKKSFSGDIIEVSDVQKKPIIFPPVPKFPQRITDSKLDIKRTSSIEIPNLLNELFIYIGGNNPSSNLNNIQVFKQFDYCVDTNGEFLVFDDIKKLLSSNIIKHLQYLNILGGNIFTYPDLDILLKELSYHSFVTRVYSMYKDIPDVLNLFPFSLNSRFILKVLIDFPIDSQNLEKTINMLIRENVNIELLFAITSLSEYKESLIFKEKYKFCICEIKPVFTGDNLDFFREYVFLTKKDLKEIRLGRNEIFLNQALNAFYFGKLRILYNSKVYSDLNKQSIGDINTPLIDMLFYEMSKKLSWFNIRDQEPCNNCIYQWLCPPLSGYEQVMAKINLCKINGL